MASIPTFSPNPYGNFDPTQWSNPYSQFQSSALPWPSSYGGPPSNAMGQPIASYQQWLQQQGGQPQPQPQAPTPGTTLNSSPALPMPSGGTNQVRGGSSNPALTASDISTYNAQQGMLAGAAQRQALAGIPNAGQMNSQQLGAAMAAQQQPGAAQGAGGAGAPPNNWQAAIQALANPGNPITPGATVPQSATAYQPSNGVLQQFLQNWRPAASGPGSGFQQAFANALQRGR